VSQTLDGMSVTELEALKARVEAALTEQREKEENAGWDIEAGTVRSVDGEWRGVGIGEFGGQVRFALRDRKVVYAWPTFLCDMVDFESRYFGTDFKDAINTHSCCRVVAQLALKALGQ